MTFRHTLESCKSHALKYNSRSAWSAGHQSSYASAKRNGWFNRDTFKKADMLKTLLTIGAKDLVGKSEKELAKMLGYYQLTGCELLKFRWENI